jgi:hypothetical protein
MKIIDLIINFYGKNQELIDAAGIIIGFIIRKIEIKKKFVKKGGNNE